MSTQLSSEASGACNVRKSLSLSVCVHECNMDISRFPFSLILWHWAPAQVRVCVVKNICHATKPRSPYRHPPNNVVVRSFHHGQVDTTTLSPPGRHRHKIYHFTSLKREGVECLLFACRIHPTQQLWVKLACIRDRHRLKNSPNPNNHTKPR